MFLCQFLVIFEIYVKLSFEWRHSWHREWSCLEIIAFSILYFSAEILKFVKTNRIWNTIIHIQVTFCQFFGILVIYVKLSFEWNHSRHRACTSREVISFSIMYFSAEFLKSLKANRIWNTIIHKSDFFAKCLAFSKSRCNWHWNDATLDTVHGDVAKLLRFLYCISQQNF